MLILEFILPVWPSQLHILFDFYISLSCIQGGLFEFSVCYSFLDLILPAKAGLSFWIIIGYTVVLLSFKFISTRYRQIFI